MPLTHAGAAGGVRALIFDVFGTCVDWRSGVIREGTALGERHRLRGVDWGRFADAWRARYQPQMGTVRSGRRPWTTLDVLHRESLDEVCREFGIDRVPAADLDAFNAVWHRLDPWPDVVAGLERLKRRYIIAPHSNGHVALLVEMAKRAGLPWDVILGAEVVRAYKPMPASYRGAVALLGLAPAETMMVAAHPLDLDAAGNCGLRTAYVPRPDEFGRGADRPMDPVGAYDVVAKSFGALASRLMG